MESKVPRHHDSIQHSVLFHSHGNLAAPTAFLGKGFRKLEVQRVKRLAIFESAVTEKERLHAGTGAAEQGHQRNMSS